MKRFAVVVVGLVVGAVGAFAQQSLGDVARQARVERKGKPPARVITNDDLAPAGATAPAPAPPSEALPSAPQEEAKAASKKPVEPAAEFAAETNEYREKIVEQKAKVAKLNAEIMQLETEIRLQASAYYADAGTRLRAPQEFMTRRMKLDADLDAKKKQLAAAVAELDDIREQARKTGVSSSAIE